MTEGGGYLVPQDEIMFIDLLESEPLFIVSVLDQVNSTVSSVGNQLDDLEIFLAGKF